jgi:hypothetical protein
MKRIAIIGAAMGLGAALSNGLGSEVVTIRDDRPLTNKRRHVSPNNRQKRASKYTPHIGAKEQERAKRCYMASSASYVLADGRHLDATPTLCQMSKGTHQECESMF